MAGFDAIERDPGVTAIVVNGEGRTFVDFDSVLLALESGEVETLTPIRVRYSGPYINLETQFDKQNIVHAEEEELV